MFSREKKRGLSWPNAKLGWSQITPDPLQHRGGRREGACRGEVSISIRLQRQESSSSERIGAAGEQGDDQAALIADKSINLISETWPE